MTYFDEGVLAGLLKAVAEVNEQLLKLAESLKVEDWFTTEKAQEMTGLTYRQVKYKVETGRWRSRAEGRRYYIYGPDIRAYNAQVARPGDNSRTTYLQE